MLVCFSDFLSSIGERREVWQREGSIPCSIFLFLSEDRIQNDKIFPGS